MPIAVLSIDLEARLGKLEQGFNKAARIAERDAEKTRAAWAKAGSVVTGVAGSIAGAFAGYSVSQFIMSNIDALDALNDVKDATGATIENISALEDVGLRTGTTMADVTSILVKFNQVLGDAKPNSPQADALQRIGLSAAELRKLDPAEALRRTAVALAAYADDGEKARLVQDLFGKSVAVAAPFLNDLAMKGQLNATATAEQAEEAEKLNKQLAEFRANISQAARGLTAELVPAINAYLNAVKGAGGVGNVILSNLELDQLALKRKELERLRLQINSETDVAGQLKGSLDKDSKAGLPVNPAVNQAYQAAQDRLKALQIRAEQASAALKSVADQLNPPEGPQASYSNEGRNSPRPSVRGAPDRSTPTKQPIDDAAQALARYVEQQQRELEQAVELTEQQKALNLLRELGATGQVPQVRELVLRLAEQNEELKRQEEIEKGIADYLAQQAAARKQIDDAIDGFSGRTGDALKRAQTERLEQRIAGGEAFTPEELEKIVKGIAGISDEVKDKLSEMDEFAKQAARNIQDSLGASIKNVLKGDFDSIGDLWANLLLDMAAQAAAARIGNELFGDFLKGGSLGGGIGDLFKLGASFFGIPGFAGGGDHAGGVRLVGERGPELEFTGPSRIVDANRTQQLLRPDRGGGRTVLQLSYAPVSYIDSRTDRAAIAADIEASHRVNNRELLALIKDRMRA